LFSALTWRRLDPLRAFHLPVRQLEGQRGPSARSRERVLGRRAAGTIGLLATCSMFEWVVAFALGMSIELFTPGSLETDFGRSAFLRNPFDADENEPLALLSKAFYIGAVALIEPLYVAGGFALYLNRRTSLEAWDLELSFRRMSLPGPSSTTASIA